MPKNPKQTSKTVASKAGKNLSKKSLPKDIKSVIASDLAQAELKTCLQQPDVMHRPHFELIVHRYNQARER